jgi:hypothetical protein
MDAIDTLQEALNGLPEDARLTVEFRFDPAGACRVVEPLRQLRRDVSLEAQLLEHLSTVGAPSGEYRVRVRNKGQHVSQAQMELVVREKQPVTPAVTPPVTPAVTPAAASVTPPVTPALNPAEQLGQELLRRTMEHLLSPPPEDDYEDEDESSSPLAGALTTVAQSPILAPATARLMDALSGFLEGRTRISDAQARLYEARSRRMTGDMSPAPAAAPQRQPLRVRRVAVPNSTSGGGSSSGSTS